MLQTLVRTAGAVTFTLATFAPSLAHADTRGVVIRVYDIATTDAAARSSAMRTASNAIASAGIAVTWRDCSRGGAAHPCRTVRDAGDLVVRIMPGQGPAEVELGFAPIDPGGRATVIATVYYDLVQRVARRTGLDAHELLGRAIAHEIGHLLLRAPGHAHSGLMRPLWTDAELAQNRPGDWTFSEAERGRVQAVARDADASAGSSPDAGDIEQTGR
jgi:hypothetical protein